MLLFCATPSRAQTPGPQDYRLVIHVPRQEADAWLKQEIARSGGDLDHGRYHFVAGFSTGHYGSDPVHAIATRRLVFSLLNNTFAPGDRVTPLGWEMDLWLQGKPISLTDDPQTRAAFVDAVPYAPQPNSRGGHDTERALYETLAKVVSPGEAKSTVVLLLTNSNQSQGPVGQRAQLFGANNPQLTAELRKLGFRDPVRHSFTAETSREKVNIEVTALFPQKIASLPGAPTTSRFPGFPVETWQPAADRPTQAETLPNPAIPPGASRSGPSGTQVVLPPEQSDHALPLIPIVIGLIFLLVLIALWLLTRKREPKTEEPKPKAPKGRPIPGSIAVTVGAAPNDVKTVLKPLTTAGRWFMSQEGDSAPVLNDEEPESGTRLAVLSFDDKNRLQVAAEPEMAFHDLRGTAVKACTPRALLLLPGDQMICSVASVAAAGARTRLEVRYQKEG